jgi:4-amino-4-deoxy-L-arabinose transferase-like glycosyltransferase
MSIAIGLAGLTKGPVVLGVMGTTFVVWLVLDWWSRRGHGTRGFDVVPTACGMGVSPVVTENHGRDARATVFKMLVGIAVIVLIVAPWVVLVERRAPGFLLTTTAHDVTRRIFEPLEQHWGPPGYYVLVIWGTYFPWSLLLPMTFVVAWRHFREDASVRFALAAVIGPWLMFECIATKLPHYLLPVFPPLAFLTADGIVRSLRGEHPDLLALGTRIAVLIWSVIVLALASVPTALNRTQTGLPQIPAMIVFVVGLSYAVAVFALFVQFRKLRYALLTMGAGMIVLMAVLFAFYLPRVQPLQLSRCIGDVLRHNGGGAESTTAGDVQMIAYKEPSLAFYQGGTIREQSENDFLKTHSPEQWPRFLTIRQDVWDDTPPEIRAKLEILGECRGWAYADKGRTWTVIVVRKRP